MSENLKKNDRGGRSEEKKPTQKSLDKGPLWSCDTENILSVGSQDGAPLTSQPMWGLECVTQPIGRGTSKLDWEVGRTVRDPVARCSC